MVVPFGFGLWSQFADCFGFGAFLNRAAPFTPPRDGAAVSGGEEVVNDRYALRSQVLERAGVEYALYQPEKDRVIVVSYTMPAGIYSPEFAKRVVRSFRVL